MQEANRPRESGDWRGLMGKNPGGDLLLRDLSSDYHWRGSVSLPGSERDRVGPLRSGHRASGGRGFIVSSSCLPGSPALGLSSVGFLIGLYEAKKIFWGGGDIQRKLTSAWLVVEIMH